MVSFYKNKSLVYLFLLLIIFFVILYFIQSTNYEYFSMRYELNEPTYELNDYENISIGNNKIYESVPELLNNNKNIETGDNIIVNIINGNSGFGSQLTLFMQTLHYFKNVVNPNIICLPHFSINADNFKYHNKKHNNSFFLYFKKRTDISNLQNYSQYFVNARTNVLENYPFFKGDIPVMNNPTNKSFIDLFSSNYDFKKNHDVEKQINEIKKPLIGIHIRSIAQKRTHDTEYLNTSTKDRLLTVKNKCDKEYGEYSIFIASDTNPNIELAKTIFNDIYYFDNITRIDNDGDIIASLTGDETGYKLGSDILNECFGLSMCDKTFLSNSNILFITSTMNPNINMEEY